VNLLKEGKDISPELLSKAESPTAESGGSPEEVALREKVCQKFVFATSVEPH